MKPIAKAVVSCGLSLSLVAGSAAALCVTAPQVFADGGTGGEHSYFAYSYFDPLTIPDGPEKVVNPTDNTVYRFKNPALKVIAYDSLDMNLSRDDYKRIQTSGFTYGDLKKIKNLSVFRRVADGVIGDLSDLDNMPNISSLEIRTVGYAPEVDSILNEFASRYKDNPQLKRISIMNYSDKNPTRALYFENLKQYTNVENFESNYDIVTDCLPPKVKASMEKDEFGDGTMYRLYNPYSHEHLYTINPVEKDNLVKIGWNFEKVVGKTPRGKGVEVHRLYNRWSGDHYYTKKADDIASCVKAGWIDEGVKFYSADKDAKGAVGMVTLFNPYTDKFTHLFTADEDEINKCVKDGWVKQDINWYVVK